MFEASTRIHTRDLTAGDILLVRGKGDLSQGIQELDGGRYSHGAVWSGQAAIEAVFPKVSATPLEQLVQRSAYVDAYRLATSDSRSIGVVAAAQRYVGQPYSAVNLSCCALLMAVTSWTPGDWLKLNALLGVSNLRRVLEIVKRAVRTSQAHNAVDSVTCVELVGRAYLDSGIALVLRLETPGQFDAPTFLAAVRDMVSRLPLTAQGSDRDALKFRDDLEWTLQLEQQLGRVSPSGQESSASASETWRPVREEWLEFTAYSPVKKTPRSPARPATNQVVKPELLQRPVDEIRDLELLVGVDWAPHLLTPRLLETSPSLMRLGRLSLV